jgi:uncharacterized protein (DUF302 family)
MPRDEEALAPMPSSHAVQYSAKRVTHDSADTFERTRSRFEEQIGFLEPEVAFDLVLGHPGWDEVVRAVSEREGPSGLICISRIDQGALLSISGEPLEATLYLVGHPVVARAITLLDPGAALYAPFRVAVYSDARGAHLSYDQPSSVLASLRSDAIDAIAADLDEKIEVAARHACTASGSPSQPDEASPVISEAPAEPRKDPNRDDTRPRK